MQKTILTRRGFMGRCSAASAALWLPSWLSPCVTLGALGAETNAKWLTMLEDPVRGMFSGKPDLDRVLALYPRTTGEPAFDPKQIAEGVKKIETSPPVATGHPLLDLSVKIGLAHIDATFQGDHPKYGVGGYAENQHDGFPPTIIAAVDALSAWGMNRRAAGLFRYWLMHFVRDNGTIDYYGTSISEYGQLLHTAAVLQQRAGPAGWWKDGCGALGRIAELLLRLHATALKENGLISGVPEADTRSDVGRFFHNNAWVVRGLRQWADLCERQGASPAATASAARTASQRLAQDTLRAIAETWPSDRADWWLPPKVEPTKRPARLAAGPDTASYTNYRYWPELLSSGLLRAGLAHRVVDARLSGGGQFCGMTRFADHLDDWPLADYLAGLWSLGRTNDFLLSLYGHVAYHQAQGHLTAYEQVTFPPGKKAADYCLPCQLVAARAARVLVGSAG